MQVGRPLLPVDLRLPMPGVAGLTRIDGKRHIDVLRRAQAIRGSEAGAREPQSHAEARHSHASLGPVDLTACPTHRLDVARCTRNLWRPALQQGQQALGRDLGQGRTHASVVLVQHIDTTTLAECGSQMRSAAAEVQLEIENGRYPLARHPHIGVATDKPFETQCGTPATKPHIAHQPRTGARPADRNHSRSATGVEHRLDVMEREGRVQDVRDPQAHAVDGLRRHQAAQQRQQRAGQHARERRGTPPRRTGDLRPGTHPWTGSGRRDRRRWTRSPHFPARLQRAARRASNRRRKCRQRCLPRAPGDASSPRRRPG